MEEVKITNLIRFYTLILLDKKPMHGYELIKELEACLSKSISASHIYPFLKTLSKNNLIELKNTGKRKKKQYCLTKKGKEYVNELINKFSIIIKSTIANKVKKCAHCDCQIYDKGYIEKIKGKRLYFCCIHCAKSLKARQKTHTRKNQK